MKGAVSYAAAGEVTPTLTLIGNRIERNCKQLYGNFSTCTSALNLDVQNMNSLYFMVSCTCPPSCLSLANLIFILLTEQSAAGESRWITHSC